MSIRKSTRKENGSGSIRKRKDGRWEGRYSIPSKDGSGAYIRKSIYGDTQEEVRKELTRIINEIDENVHIEPVNIKLGIWIDDWMKLYVANTVKQLTYDQYVCECNHIKEELGEIKLSNLKSSHIQAFYNKLLNVNRLSPKTVKNIHGVLHKALDQAVELEYIKTNPSNKCKLPKANNKEFHPMETDEISRFLELIEKDRFKNLFYTTLFVGLRRGEVLGLTWDCVDFDNCTITINKQLKRDTHYAHYKYILDSTKNSKARTIRVATPVMVVLADQKKWQQKASECAGGAWSNEMNLVFTNELGRNLKHDIVYKSYKKIVTELGRPDLRLHDLRHTYATISIEAGDDIKTVQGNLGHATASFTLDRYGHVSEKMKLNSAQNIENFINKVS